MTNQPPIRAVIDTNVLFEGLTHQGNACGLLVDAWIGGHFRPCVSTSLAFEYRDVLARKLSPARWERIKPVLGRMLRQADYVAIYYTWRPASPDPGDDHLIDCAMNGSTPLITLNQRDFRQAERSLGLTVLSPAAFLNLLIC